MHPRQFAFYGGIIMLLFGVAALLAPGPIVGLPDLRLETSYGWFLGIFPMNIVNKAAILVFGLFGVIAGSLKFTSLPASIFYSRVVFFVMGALAVLGLFHQTATLNGYWPLFGPEVAFHAVLAVIGGYFGYALSSQVPEVKRGPSDYRSPVH